jgi:hypothetical protein
MLPFAERQQSATRASSSYHIHIARRKKENELLWTSRRSHNVPFACLSLYMCGCVICSTTTASYAQNEAIDWSFGGWWITGKKELLPLLAAHIFRSLDFPTVCHCWLCIGENFIRIITIKFHIQLGLDCYLSSIITCIGDAMKFNSICR